MSSNQFDPAYSTQSSRTAVWRILFSAATTAAVVALTLAGLANASPQTAVQVTNFSADDGSNAQFQAAAVSAKTGKGMALMFVNDDGGVNSPRMQAQMLDVSGSAEGEPVTLTGTADSYENVGIAWNPLTGGWLACFDDLVLDLVCQRLNANGSLLGSPIELEPSIEIFYANINPVWSTEQKKFLVEYAGTRNQSGMIEARWLDPADGSIGSLITISAVSSTTRPDGSGQMAYSPTSNTFFIVQRVRTPSTVYSSVRSYGFLLDGDGQPVGSALGPFNPDGGNSPSVAYNKSRDEFAVVWRDYSADPSPLGFQRVDASDGAFVGTAQFIPFDFTGYDTSTYRSSIAAHPTADQLLVLLNLDSTVTGNTEVVGLEMDGAGNAGTQIELPGPTGNKARPRVVFNAGTCEYLITYQGVAASNSFPQLFSTRYTQPAPCPVEPSGAKPSLHKVGTPGPTSLKVRVGCAGGSGPCRIKLSGSLKGGGGGLESKTVRFAGVTSSQRATAKRTVTLRYTSRLIASLERSQGGRIKVRATQVSGGSRTVTVRVPFAVTG